MTNETAYWITLAHLPGWGPSRINTLIIKFFHDRKISIVDFFELEESVWKEEYQLDEKQIGDLRQAKQELAGNAFLAESLQSQGIEVIPITSPDYSRTLKANLKTAHAPAVLYIKGNKKLLHEKSIAIVGSRNASEKALSFTDNIAKLASEDYRVVVSGFAKGVDKQALDSALEHKGQSIIVLPQGIMTFGSGLKTYYKKIIEGDVLVMSTFFPKSPWRVELAMARNAIIYGLADEIYVAESAEKGGTWSGVVDGLRKGRKIFVRLPDAGEETANGILIQKGAVAVDFSGKEMPTGDLATDDKATGAIKQNGATTNSSVSENIRALLNGGGSLSAKELLQQLNIGWSSRKLGAELKKLDFVEVSAVKPTKKYRLRKTDNVLVAMLFSDV